MTAYPNLDGPVARRTDPATSWAAAQSLSDGHVRGSQQAVLSTLRQSGPLTDPEIMAAIHAAGGTWSDSRLRTARKELCARGLVHAEGTTRGLTGSQFTRWAATPTQQEIKEAA